MTESLYNSIELPKDKKYYVITGLMCQRNQVCKLGLNESPDNSTELEFADLDRFLGHIDNYTSIYWIFEVELLEDSIIQKTRYSYATNKFILKNKMTIYEFYCELSYEELLKHVSQFGYLLKYVDKQTEEICLAACSNYPDALEYVKEQTLDICLVACKLSGWALEHVKEQTQEICYEACKSVGLALKYVKFQSDHLCLVACSNYGNVLKYVITQTEEICIAACRQTGMALKYVKIPHTPEIVIAAGINYPAAIVFAKCPITLDILMRICEKNQLLIRLRDMEDLYLFACMKNGMILEYIRNQTPELCLAAVCQNGMALEHVRGQTPEICQAALMENSEASIYVTTRY